MATWVDLGDLYTKKAGDTVSGNIIMSNNNLSVVNGDNTYNVGTEIKSLWDSVSQKTSYEIIFDDDSINFNDPITLSKDPTQFSFVQFFCMTDDKEIFSVCWDATSFSQKFVASTSHLNPYTQTMYLKTRTFQIASKTVNTMNDTSGESEVWLSGYVALSSSGVRINYTDKIKIIKAIGWY